MRMLPRVVWSEGMHLAQHHFQSQSRYFEDLIGFTVSNLFFEPYGSASLELDAEALFNGTVALTHAHGIMPDGLVFQFPADPVPEPLEVREIFSPTQDSHLVLLAVHAYRPRQANCAFEVDRSSAEFRFSTEARAIPDETTGQDEKPVVLARKNFRLLLDTQLTDGLISLPIARVRRDGAGHFVYDADYVPPCIRIGASARLMQLLAGLVESLDAKASAMIAQRQASRSAMAEYASREVADFWLSHTLHSSLPTLRQLLLARSCHPEALFAELSRLAGALCTFSLQSDPRSLPRYDHRDLGRCFDALERHVRDHLEVVLPTRAVTIPLQRASAEQLEAHSAIDPQMLEAYRDFLVGASPYFFLGAVDDRRCFDKAVWYLGVRSSAGHGDTVRRVPALVKVCSAKHIARLVKDAYPGLDLQHVSAPPPQISPRPDTVYFRLQMEGGCWTSLVQTGRVGVYVPAAIADAELEIAVVPAQ
jgi:type VI secretion system protein ImpJ